MVGGLSILTYLILQQFMVGHLSAYVVHLLIQ